MDVYGSRRWMGERSWASKKEFCGSIGETK
jgi:hypothetical protein